MFSLHHLLKLQLNWPTGSLAIIHSVRQLGWKLHFSLYHQKFPLTKVFCISRYHAHFRNMHNQNGPQHALKVWGGLVQPAGRSSATDRQKDYRNSAPSVTCTHYAHNLFPQIFPTQALRFARAWIKEFQIRYCTHCFIWIDQNVKILSSHTIRASTTEA